VCAQCLERVATARGREPAWRGPTLHSTLVPQDQADETGIWRNSDCRSALSWANDRAAMAGWPPTRYSPGGNWPDDAADCNRLRSRRRTRLRVTAGPRARPNANATRGGVSLPCGSSTNVHHRTPARIRLPSAVRRPKVRRSRIRQIKPTDGGGPWRAEPSARRGPHGCSCGCGSHASWHGDGCWVGRCASRSPPRAARGSTHGSTNIVLNGRSRRTHHDKRQDYGRATRGGNRSSRGGVRRARDDPLAKFASLPHSRRLTCPHSVDNSVDFSAATGRRCR
jgi:hypothetical protein